MNRALVRTVALVTTICAVALAAANASAAPRIIGGDKVAPADYQARYTGVVSIQIDVSVLPASVRERYGDLRAHTCGGTLISLRLVVTAAHCVAPGGLFFASQRYEVLAGQMTLSSTAHTKTGRVAVQDIYVHPSFRSTSQYASYGYGFGGETLASTEFDVAVLRLERPITSVTPIPVVRAGEDSSWGSGEGRATGAIALGWGETFAPFYSGRHREPKARDLQAVGQIIRADRRCERSDEGLAGDAADFDADTMICAGTADGPAKGNAALTPCYGDSGGPLVAPVADGSLRLVGVTSWTSSVHPCATWGVFTRLAGVRDWIASIPEDANGPGNLMPPTGVAATRGDDPDELHVTWTPSASGSVVQYRVHRQALVGFPFFGLSSSSPAVLAVGAVTGGDGTGVDVYGVEPQRRGQHEQRTIRVDAQDAAGNRVQGAVTRVAAPVDTHAPSTPGRPGLRANGGRPVFVRFAGSLDDDCVGAYRLDVRAIGSQAWHTNRIERVNTSCDSLAFPYFYYFGGNRNDLDGPQKPSSAVGQLAGLAAGDYAVRVVALDRAGNASRPSRAMPLHLEQRIPRRSRRNSSCVVLGLGVICGSSRSTAVDVIVG